MKKPILIAEMGKYHCGNVKTAKKMIASAARAGVHAVKFQAYEISDLMPDHENYKRNKLYHLTLGELADLKKVCDKSGVDFWCSCFSKSLLKPLSSFTDTVKIPSTYLELDDFINSAKNSFKKIHVSTGFHPRPYVKEAMEKHKDCVFYHCTSEYPVEVKYNLSRIKELGMKGYSHHSKAIAPMITAWLLGAEFIEFHYSMGNDPWRMDEQSVRYLRKQIGALCPSLRDTGASLKVEKNYEFFRKEFKDLLPLVEQSHIQQKSTIVRKVKQKTRTNSNANVVSS